MGSQKHPPEVDKFNDSQKFRSSAPVFCGLAEVTPSCRSPNWARDVSHLAGRVCKGTSQSQAWTKGSLHPASMRRATESISTQPLC